MEKNRGCAFLKVTHCTFWPHSGKTAVIRTFGSFFRQRQASQASTPISPFRCSGVQNIARIWSLIPDEPVRQEVQKINQSHAFFRPNWAVIQVPQQGLEGSGIFGQHRTEVPLTVWGCMSRSDHVQLPHVNSRMSLFIDRRGFFFGKTLARQGSK